MDASGNQLPELTGLIEAARARRPRALARMLSMVEDGGAGVRELTAALAAPPRATVVGITGAPGVGKSTSTAALVDRYRAEGRTVAVLAVDPSSPFTGGALLGDRVRMQQHACDDGVYIRSMATRGQLGGLALSSGAAVRLLDAVGFDVVLLETVGVGQSEVDVAGIADTTLVLLAPGMGDGVQAAKAGVLEVGDVYVVNKADRDGAQALTRELRQMLALGRTGEDAWSAPIVPTTASDGTGIDDVVRRIAEHREWSERTGELERRRRRRAHDEVEALARVALAARLDRLPGPDREVGLLDDLAGEVAGGADPYAAADRLVDVLLGH